MNKDPRPKTLFIDIDGVLLFQYGGLDQQMHYPPKILDGVLDKLHEWDTLGYILILVTGRKESMRELTMQQLQDCGIYYDQLIMGCGGGQRVLINNVKQSFPDMPTALGFTILKNFGLSNIHLEDYYYGPTTADGVLHPGSGEGNETG